MRSLLFLMVLLFQGPQTPPEPLTLDCGYVTPSVRVTLRSRYLKCAEARWAVYYSLTGHGQFEDPLVTGNWHVSVRDAAETTGSTWGGGETVVWAKEQLSYLELVHAIDAELGHWLCFRYSADSVNQEKNHYLFNIRSRQCSVIANDT